MQCDRSASLDGRELGGYRLLHQLGAGGGGVVYLAQRLDQPQELFALKVLDPTAVTDARIRATLRARFIREAEAVQRLRHSHIVPILAFGEEQGYLFMALPFMKGGDLAAQIGKFPRGMPLDAVATDLTQIASALDEAHRHGIVHRDIKPTNILLDEHGTLFLADFGIARLLADEGATSGAGIAPPTLTTTGQTLGTPQYMAPEQVNGQTVGPAADIYALGIVLYQMIAGAPPFMGETPIAVAMKQVQEAPTPLRTQRPDLPAVAEAVILRALAKQPSERYPSAGALAEAFTAALRSRPDGLSATPPTLATQAPTPTLMAPEAAAFAQTAPVNIPSSTPWASRYESDHTSHPPTQKTFSSGWAIAAAITLLSVVLAGVGYASIHYLANGQASGTGTGTSNQIGASTTAQIVSSPPTATSSVVTQQISPLIPAGSPIYQTQAAGSCDQHGATWASNGGATQSCDGGALVLSAQECNCAIGIATLDSIPASAYPSDYVVQVNANILGGVSTAKFGFKFRQQSIQDVGQGRGGYSFLVDPNGQWQFNIYDADGTRHILAQQQLASPISGVHTLDLSVSGATYSFYIDAQLIAQEQDSTYSAGLLCLAIEPGATIGFRNFALYSSN